jgi:rhodanese-related sulfurtransferase
MTRKQVMLSLAAAVLLFCILPLVLYLWIVQGAPSVSIDQASELLRSQEGGYLLVDVRQPEDYLAMHLDGSINWPLKDILAATSVAEIPAYLVGRPILMLCDNGLSNALAVRRVRSLGGQEAYIVRSGFQGWIAQDTMDQEPFPNTVVLADGRATSLPRVELSIFQQATTITSLYLIKPLYMLLSAGLVFLLRNERSAHLRVLRWGVAVFFVGEFACWVNFSFFKVESLLLEYVHSVSMVAMLGCLAWAVSEILETWIIRSREPEGRCAILEICRGCGKLSDGPCAIRRIYKLITLSFLILSVMPFLLPLQPVSYNGNIFGFFRNFMHPTTIQLYEFRLCPVIAFLCLGITYFLLISDNPWSNSLGNMLFSIGVGHLGFSYLRMTLLTPFFNDLVWFVFWEESTELLLMGALAYLVWVFRPDSIQGFIHLLDKAGEGSPQ